MFQNFTRVQWLYAFLFVLYLLMVIIELTEARNSWKMIGDGAMAAGWAMLALWYPNEGGLKKWLPVACFGVAIASLLMRMAS